MKLTTKGKFAVTAMLHIALYSDGQPIKLADISSQQGISLSYLEQLFVKLRRSGMVKSYKGPGGGYVLVHDAAALKISSIIQAVDDDMDARTCHGKRNCQGSQQCLTHDLWHGLTQQIYQYLDKISLHDLLPSTESAHSSSATALIFCNTRE